MNRPQIASSVLAFLMLATMMARGTEEITEVIEQKKEYLVSKEIVAEYSNEVVLQDKMLQKVATVSNTKDEMQKCISSVHTVFISVDEDLASRQCILPVNKVQIIG